MRGKVKGTQEQWDMAGITPAYAGKSNDHSCISVWNGDHPRVCGEKKSLHSVPVVRVGSPPRMRGKERGSVCSSYFARITPAYAGKSEKVNGAGNSFQDHPRVCGEKVSSTSPMKCLKGSPPRMRGKGSLVCPFCSRSGITPAYAGKRFIGQSPQDYTGDHPRVCGEKLSFAQTYCFRSGSPPRMRGKDQLSCVERCQDGITPAYAGKRAPPYSPGCFLRDHPRVCGEK